MPLWMEISLLFVIVSYLCYYQYRRKKTGNKNRRAFASEIDDLNRQFLDAADDQATIAFAKVWDPTDLMVIRSLLDSAGIASYVEGAGIQGLFPGIQLKKEDGEIISIFESDSEEAREIICDYILSIQAGSFRTFFPVTAGDLQHNTQPHYGGKHQLPKLLI